MARQSLRRSPSPRSRLSLKAPGHLAQVCLELPDYSEARYSAIDFFQTRSARDPAAQAARIAEQFITRNRALMLRLDAQMEGDYDGHHVVANLQRVDMSDPTKFLLTNRGMHWVSSNPLKR